jgi:uncharacterized membrane protein YoaK (UPF0700 family)
MPLSPRQRRFRHTLALTALLALAAGTVNVVALEAFGALVANVTGHATQLGRSGGAADSAGLFMRLLWILAFVGGAAASTILMRPAQRRGWHFVYAGPLLLELLTIIVAAALGRLAMNDPWLTEEVVALLLLAMGLQNAMVTFASGAVIRTTHLTGIMTDIGMNLGRLVSGDQGTERRETLIRLGLHGTIAGSFIGGAAAGTFLWRYFGFETLTLAIVPILAAVLYDIWLARAEHRDPEHFASKRGDDFHRTE